jgi:hypothetical protein
MVYADGQPVIVDVGLGTYTAKTFSKDRYSLWYLSSAYHNLPTINGVQQAAGRKYEAREVRHTDDPATAELQMDIAAAYPPEAGVHSWKRRIILDKLHNEVSIRDAFQLEKMTEPLTQTFMTVCPVEVPAPGRILFLMPGNAKVLLEYDPGAWEMRKELMETTGPDEKRIADNWGHRPIWRLLLVGKTRNKKGTFTYKIRQL